MFVNAGGEIVVNGLEKAFKGDLCEDATNYSYFSCPEMINIGYFEDYGLFDNKTDIWSSGCILHLLLSDDLEQPFNYSDDIRYDDPPKLPERISAEARALVKMLLNKDPSKRPSAKEILAMPLLKPIVEELNK